MFISGNGSNARNLINFFSQNTAIKPSLVLSSRLNPNMEQYCVDNQVNYAEIVPWEEPAAVQLLQHHSIDVIVLAGFLKKVGDELLQLFPNRIINIHPALLPNYGGKGMYGRYVHEAVWRAKETESGITIHLVNEHYDEGAILKQYRCPLGPNDSPIDIENKVRELELRYLPTAVAEFCRSTYGRQ